MGNLIGVFLVVVPLGVGALGLVYYAMVLLKRRITTPTQAYEEIDGELFDEQGQGDEMNLKLPNALQVLSGAYKRATESYVELLEWEEENQRRAELAEEQMQQPQPRLVQPLERLQTFNQPLAPAAAVEPELWAPSTLSLGDGLKRLIEEKALIVLGPKGSGKTTFGLALLHAVIHLGYEFCVIDPHAELNDWPEDLVVAGAGRDYAQANAYIKAVYAEMDIRYKRENKARRTPLFVFIDEVPGISAKCKNWSLTDDIVREARKVDIHFIILSQSELVKDIGLNTASKTNFTTLALGNARHKHQAEMSHLDKNEKRALTLAYRSNKRLAVIDGEDMPVLMDLTGADKIRSPREQHIWLPDELVVEQLDKFEREALATMAVQKPQDEDVLASLLSSVSGAEPLRNPVGTSVGTSVGTYGVPNTGNPSSNAGSNEVPAGSRVPVIRAWNLIKEASEPERRSLAETLKLFTNMGKEAAIMKGFELNSKGRGYQRGKELLDAWLLLQSHQLVK